MAEDALERLMQRQRPSVPPRADGLGAELPVKSPQQVVVGGNGSGYKPHLS